jgi:hypothetical protein
MGISKATVSLFFELKTEIPLGGVICQLGRQTTDVPVRQAGAIARKFSFSSAMLDAEESETGGKRHIDDVLLFRTLGFERVESLDASPYENATHIHDFNLPVPEPLHGKYDLIFDGGTLEHIFDFPQCLQNIHLMLKPGGLVVHCSPTNNYVDHGFYMFSPTLFADYYSANQYKIVRSRLLQYSLDLPQKRSIVYDYLPGSLDRMGIGAWGRDALQTWLVAQKTPEATSNVIPQQGTYLRTWPETQSAASRPNAIADSRVRSIGRRVRDGARANVAPYVFIFRLLAPAIFFYRVWQRRRRPRVVARY